MGADASARTGRSWRLALLRLTPVAFLLAALAGMLLTAGSSAASTTCTIYWTGKTSNDWATKANWSLTNNGPAAPRTPAATDYVCMSTSAVSTAVVLSGSTTATIDGINWPLSGSINPSLEVDGSLTVGTKSAANPSTIQSLIVDGTLTSFKGEALTAVAFSQNGDVEGAGTLTASGGANLNNGASLGSDGTGAHLILQGSSTQSGGLIFDYGSELENQGTLTLSDSSNLEDNYDPSTASQLVNDSAGTITYPGSGNNQSASIEVDNTNAGTISVSEGSLQISDGNGPAGADTGTFTAASGATIDLGGTRSEAKSATIAGAGTVDITGTTAFTAAENLTNTGTVEVDDILAVGTAVNVTAINLTLDGDLEGPGTLTVSGAAKLANGASLGSDGTGAHLILQGSSSQNGTLAFDYGSELENQGFVTLSDSSNLQDNYDPTSTPDQLVNDSNGIINYTGSASSQSASIEVDNTNAGIISVSQGTLDISDGNGPAGADTGTFSAFEGAVLDLGGTRSEGKSANVDGSGKVDITGTTTFTASENLTNTGTFEVDDILALSTGVNVTATNLTLDGDLEGPGTLTVNGGAALNNGASLGGEGTGAHLILQGFASSQSGTLDFDYGSELENQGTLTLSDSSNLNDNYNPTSTPDQLVNDSNGTISYPASASGQSASIEVDNTNAGTISVSQGGMLDISDGNGPGGTDTGTFTAASGATLDLDGTRSEGSGATIAGTGTVDITGTTTFTKAANLTNTGTFQIDGDLQIASGINVTAADLTLTLYGDVDGPGTLTVTGPATLASDAQLGDQGSGVHLILQGATNQTGNLYLNYGSELENEGTLTLSDSTNQPVLTDNSENSGQNSQLVNDNNGTITYTGSTASKTATISVTLTNNGTLLAAKGTLTVNTLTNLSAGSLTGGTYETTGGTLSLPGAITTNAATIIDGQGSITSSGSNALTGITSNSGTLDVQKALALSGQLANSGTIIVDDSSTLTLSKLTQSAGTTTVVGGSTLKATANAVTINGGKLIGTGTVTGNVSGTGTVSPAGAIAGPLTASGTYSSAGGTLQIPISGSTTPGTDFGQLSVAGAATLGGTLQIQTASGYTPPVGTTYTILKAGSISGTFNSVTGTQLSGESYSVSYTATSVVLTVVANSQPAPTVTNVNPSSGPVAGGTSVTITGSGFTGATAVHFGSGNPATTFTINSDTSITATSPAGSGTVDVTVTTASGTSATSSADQFVYQAASTAPTVTGVSPSIGTPAGGTKVTITGTNFTSSAVVDFGTTKATVKSETATQLVVTSPKRAAGVVDVTVTTVHGTSATSSADQYTYGTPPTPPAVTKVSPTSGPTSGGTTVTITGKGFTMGSTVQFGSNPAASVTYKSATTLTAVSPAGGAATVDITVTTSAGTSAASSKDHFTYTAAKPPAVTKISPTSGSTAGGTKVTITGTNFTSTSTVQFGSAAATTVSYKSATTLTATSPAESAGTVDITVTTSGGTSATTSKDHFTFK